jgi:hypothetical protein
MKRWMKSELISIIVDHIQWQIENIQKKLLYVLLSLHNNV